MVRKPEDESVLRSIREDGLPATIGLYLSRTYEKLFDDRAPAARAVRSMVRAMYAQTGDGSAIPEWIGKAITVDRFEPKLPGRYPAVLVIHGAGGTTIGGPWFRESARMLARRGYVAHVVHYFDLTGTRVADMPTMRANISLLFWS